MVQQCRKILDEAGDDDALGGESGYARRRGIAGNDQTAAGKFSFGYRPYLRAEILNGINIWFMGKAADENDVAPGAKRRMRIRYRGMNIRHYLCADMWRLGKKGLSVNIRQDNYQIGPAINAQFVSLVPFRVEFLSGCRQVILPLFPQKMDIN